MILDLNYQNDVPYKINQHDKDTLDLEILNDGLKLDMTGIVFSVFLKNSEGLYEANYTVNNNIITVYTSSFSSVKGITGLQVVVEKDNRQVKTFLLNINVNASVLSGQSNSVIIDGVQALNEANLRANKTLDDINKAIADGSVATQNDLLLKADNNKVFDYVFSPQDSIPSKQGVNKCTHKIVVKKDSGELLVIQKTEKSYARYTLNDKSGANSDNSNYGGEHQLIRLVDLRPLESIYVYKDIATPKTGTLATYQAPMLNANALEQSLLNIGSRQDNRNISSKAGSLGCGIYSMTFNTEVVYDINYTYSNKGNLAFMVSPTSVENVIISINNIEVKRFNPRMWLKGGQLSYGVVEFEVPTLTSTSTYELKIRAEGSGGYFYPCCFNFYELEKFNGQDIDNWKGFGSAKDGALTTGANDYALCDNSNKWFGSYHGGETREQLQITWDSTLYPKLDSTIYQETFDTIQAGQWRVLKNFAMYQKTDLINKSKMVSIFNFDTDGTIDMKFSFTVYGDLLLNAFCTALTCTNTKFSYIFMPQFIFFGDNPTGKDISIPLSEGFVRQVDPSNKLQLDIRFTKFNHMNNKKGAYILDHSYYRKFYYNVVSNVSNCNIPTLQFSKSLDFTSR